MPEPEKTPIGVVTFEGTIDPKPGETIVCTFRSLDGNEAEVLETVREQLKARFPDNLVLVSTVDGTRVDVAPPAPGAVAIAAERARQITEEGWTPEHDDQYDADEIAYAAVAYALPPRQSNVVGRVFTQARGGLWPWDRSWWKPSPDDRVRELAKAGALIAAEIDRLQRERARP